MGPPPYTGMNFNCTATQPGKDNYDDYPVQFAEQYWSKVPVGGPTRQGSAGGSNPSTSTQRTFNLSNQGNVSGTYNTRTPTSPSETCNTYFNNNVNVSGLSSRQRKRVKGIFYMLIKNNINRDEASKLCLMPLPEIFARVPTLEPSKEFAHLKPKPEVLQEKAPKIEEGGYNTWIIQDAGSFVASILNAQTSSQPVEVVPPPTGYGDQMNESHWSSCTQESRLATENYRSSRSRSPESSNYKDRIGDDRKRHRSPYTQENRVKTKRFRDGPSRSNRSPKSDYRDQIDDRERYRSLSTQKIRAGTERYVGVAEPDPCQYCRNPGHEVAECGKFLAQRVMGRRTIAKKRMWCYWCLGIHLARDCAHPHPCKGCGGNHHHILCNGGAVTPAAGPNQKI